MNTYGDIYLRIVKSTIFDEYVWRYLFTYCEIYDLLMNTYGDIYLQIVKSRSFREYVCRYLHTDGDIYM